MNRFTSKFDSLCFGVSVMSSGFTDVEYILFNGTNDSWWDSVFSFDVNDEIYNEVFPLFVSLLANMSDDDMNEYLAQYQ